MCAIEANRGLKRHRQPFWQCNYYEQVICQGKDLDQIRDSIIENPLRWDQDPESRR